MRRNLSHAERVRRVERSLRVNSLFAGALSVACVVASVAGLFSSHPKVSLLIWVPMAAFFGWMAWFMHPGTEAKLGPLDHAIDRFFDRLGIEWFTGPRNNDGEQDRG